MKEIAVIGYGAAGVVTVQKILDTHPQVQVSIYDSGDRSAAFTQKTNAFLLNTRIADMSLSPTYSFQDFLKDRGMGSISDFVPRFYFGEYLDHYRKQQQRDFRVRVVPHKVMLDDPELQGKIAILCGGDLVPNELKLNHARAFEYPWNLEKLSQLKSRSKVLVWGASLSALDIVSFLNSGDHEYTLVSRTCARLLPHLTSIPELTAEVKNRAETFSRLIDLFRLFRELDDSKNYALVKVIRQRQSKLWQGFTPREKRQFQKWISPYWRVQRHRAPDEGVRLLQDLEKQGKLRYFKAQGKKLELSDYDAVINTSGFRMPQGIATDDYFQVIDSFLKTRADRVFVVGMMNFKNHFESNAVPDFIRQASGVVSRL